MYMQLAITATELQKMYILIVYLQKMYIMIAMTTRGTIVTNYSNHLIIRSYQLSTIML